MVALAVSAYAARRRGRRLSGPADQHEGRTVRRLMQLDRDAVALAYVAPGEHHSGS
jgi:hypothetical protein